MSNLIERLRKKGWSDQDIGKAIAIIEKSKTVRSKKIQFLDSIVYWVVLFVALIGNFVISIILIPFLLAMEGIRLIIIIAIIGFAFGAFFDMILKDLKDIEDKQIIIAGVFLPLLALINVSLMVMFANYLQETLKIVNAQHSPILISAIYAAAFIFPHIIRSILFSFEMKKSSIAFQKF